WYELHFIKSPGNITTAASCQVCQLRVSGDDAIRTNANYFVRFAAHDRVNVLAPGRAIKRRQRLGNIPSGEPLVKNPMQVVVIGNHVLKSRWGRISTQLSTRVTKTHSVAWRKYLRRWYRCWARRAERRNS